MNFPNLLDPIFWLAILQIIWINVLLSGDNAVVIALACRQLPDRTRKWGIALGAGVAVVLRILFTGIVATILVLPWLKMLGGLALLYIAIDLINPDDGDDESKVKAHDTLWRAVVTVAVADMVMSLDNVVAIAAVAKGNWTLLTLGLAISIPMIIVGAALITALFERFPFLVWAGAALLGWIAGDLIISDPGIMERIGETTAAKLDYFAAGAGSILVLAAGWLRNWIHHRKAKTHAQPEAIVKPDARVSSAITPPRPKQKA